MSLRIVLDLDDTLYRERDYAIGGFAAASRHLQQAFGAPDTTDRMTQLLDSGHLGQLFRIVLDDVHPDHGPEDLRALLAAYAAHEPSLSLFDDAVVLLDELAERRLPLGLITDGHHRTQQRKVTALGIADRFGHIVYTGALGADRAFHKPHPRAFELMEGALGGGADRFVYIGDNPTKDFLAPNARGWITVMVDRPQERGLRIHRLSEPAEGGAAHHVVASLADVPRVLGL